MTASEAEGCGFNSRRAHHFLLLPVFNSSPTEVMSEDKSSRQTGHGPAAGAAEDSLQSWLPRRPARPEFSVKVKNAAGQEVVLGDPRATRALVALMDTEAVNGGAACHWGGPSAFAEIMSAIHGIMFATKGRPGMRPTISSTTPATRKTAFMPCAAIMASTA